MRRGISLVGSVKSGALVEVVSRGHPIAEAAAASEPSPAARFVPAWGGGVRSAGIVTRLSSATVRGSTRCRAQPSKGDHSRHRDFRRRDAILAGLTLLGMRGRCPGRVGCQRGRGLGGDGYLVGGGALDRATLMAVIYSCRAIDGAPTLTLRSSPACSSPAIRSR